MIKQALKASGTNCTEAHMVDVSLCGLFLLQVARQVDEQIRTPCRSSHHTVRDAKADIKKMALHMLESKVSTEVQTRTSPTFDNPVHQGMEKINSGWLSEFVAKSSSEIDYDIDPPDTSELDADINYELYVI